jgi:hypothetical protein
MTTPRFRHWLRTSGPKVWSGLLIGLGLVILVITQFLKPGLSKTGFMTGMILTLAGIAGMVTTPNTR